MIMKGKILKILFASFSVIILSLLALSFLALNDITKEVELNLNAEYNVLRITFVTVVIYVLISASFFLKKSIS